MESKEGIAKPKQNDIRSTAFRSTCAQGDAAFPWGFKDVKVVMNSKHRAVPPVPSISGGGNGAQFFSISLAATQLSLPPPKVTWAGVLTT